MALSAGTAFIEILPDTSKLGSTLNTAVTKQATPAKGAFSKLGGNLGGALAGGFAAVGVTSILKSAVGEAEEAQKVTAQTAAVLKSTGEAAGVSADHVGDLASRLSDIAAVDDDVIQQGENVLLTFTNVKNAAGEGNDVFDQATTAALDLSSAMGTDLQGSVIQVGKALNDPIKGITALSRVGVSFTEQQKDQIKTLVESGDTLGAQKIILGELRKEFGGTAAANATASGHMKVAFGELEESLGQALIPVLGTLADIITPITKAFSNLPGPLKSTFVAVGLAAGAFKLFGGNLFGTLGSLGRLVGILPKVAAETTAVALAEGEAGAAASVASKGGLAGLIGSLKKAGPLAVIAAGAIYDLQGAQKIWNAQQATNKANAHARAQEYEEFANKLGLAAIETGRLTHHQAGLLRLYVELREKGMANAAQVQTLKDAQAVLNRRVLEGRISYDTYKTAVHQAHLQLEVTTEQVERSTVKVKGLSYALGRIPKHVNTQYILDVETHYKSVGAPPVGTPGNVHAPQILAQTGWHGWTNGPTWFLAGEGRGRPHERVDIGPSGGRTDTRGGPAQIVVKNTLNVDRRRLLQADNYELRYGGA